MIINPVASDDFICYTLLKILNLLEFVYSLNTLEHFSEILTVMNI
jgi:hypothetical protein